MTDDHEDEWRSWVISWGGHWKGTTIGRAKDDWSWRGCSKVTRGPGSAGRAVEYRGRWICVRPSWRSSQTTVTPIEKSGPPSVFDVNSNAELMDTTSVHEVRFLILKKETATYGRYFLFRRPSSHSSSTGLTHSTNRHTCSVT